MELESHHTTDLFHEHTGHITLPKNDILILITPIALVIKIRITTSTIGVIKMNLILLHVISKRNTACD